MDLTGLDRTIDLASVIAFTEQPKERQQKIVFVTDKSPQRT